MDTYVFLDENEKYVPDIAVVCNPSIVDANKGIFGAPDLVAEVLSPSTTRRDKGHKKNIYEKYGVGEYWLVDIKLKSIEVYMLENGRYELDNIYLAEYTETELEDMSEQRRAEISFTFKTSLFDDLVIDVREIFEDLP